MNLFKYLTIVITLSLIFTAVSSKIINKGLRKSPVDFFGKMNAAGDSSQKIDIILVGSSRVGVQVDPRIIDSATGLNSYNFGLNSAAVKTYYNIINFSLLNHPGAKIVLVSIDYNTFDLGKDPYKDPFFYAYENNSQHSFSITDSKLFFLHSLHIFDVSMYDDMVKFSAINGFINPNRPIFGMYKGYYPTISANHFEIPPTELISNDLHVPFTEKAIDILRKIIVLCKQKQTKLIFVVAPYSNFCSIKKYVYNYSMIFNTVKSIADSNKVPFFDHSNNFLAQDTSYFYDLVHLKVKGAEIYSRLLGDDIRKTMSDLK